MKQKWKSLIFSIPFLTMATFSAQAMDESLESDRANAYCKRYKLSEWFVKEAYNQVKGKAFDLNEYDVTNLAYHVVFKFNSTRRAPGEFQMLYDLFTIMPIDKREAAFSTFNKTMVSGGEELLDAFYITSDGIETTCNYFYRVEWPQFNISREENARYFKEAGLITMSLKEKLIGLPYEPSEMWEKGEK